jgi:D-arabinose 1-dehydrogenase-like Zn-dependent alcohol dehydrogenase
MKGIFISEFNKPYIYRTDIPTPQLTNPHNMIVQIKAAGFCHTELMALAGDFGGKPGFVPGHEPCGVVAVVGPNVTKIKPGDRVGCGLFRNPCNECRECKRGTTNYCAKVELGGLTVDGGMAEYYLADPNWAVRLPDEMSYETAEPLMCAGSTIYNSILRAGQPKGAVLAIVGLGGLGHLGVQFAKALGYRVVAVDTRSAPIDLVNSLPERFRPDLILNPLNDTPEIAIRKIWEIFPG